jgi:hypothetical protein
MSDIRGSLKVKVGGKSYTLFVGMSVLADLQDKHGQDVLEKMDPPEGASENWMPDLNIAKDLFLGALQRFHSDVADRWIVDDIIAENVDALPQLMGASFPDAKSPPKLGKPRSRKKATA